MLTAWVPLQDSDDSMGTLRIIDGSHRWPITERLRELQLRRGFDMKEDETIQQLRDTGLEVHVIPLELRAGQVSFHHCLTFHGSAPNLSRRTRIAVSIHLQDRENRYQRTYDSAGLPHRHNTEDYVRRDEANLPDLTDSTFCPILWEIAPHNEASSLQQRKEKS